MSNHDSKLDEPEKIEPDISERKHVGLLLKNERIKRGLNIDQVSEATRLRPYILEILENESWDDLPSPVLAPGYIRSYGNSLGLDGKHLTALFHEAFSVKRSPLTPLVSKFENDRKFHIVLIFILVFSIIAYYGWKKFNLKDKLLDSFTKPVTIIDKPETALKKIPEYSPLKQINENKEKDSTLTVLQQKETSTESPEQDTALTNGEPAEISEKKAESIETDSMPKNNPAFKNKVTIIVNEETWLKVSLDNNEAKEYIFHPGATPEWESDKNIDMVIGNAGGITLEFNGEKHQNLGKSGQVIHLLLPQDFKKTD